MDKIFDTLRDMGFEEREIKIYLTLIREGSLSALNIARNAGIDRTTTYDILERLILKGIVSSHIKNKSKQFSALVPKKLLEYFRDKYSALERIIPEMNDTTKPASNAVKCELFQGREGLKSVCTDLVNNAKEYKVIGITNEYEKMLGYFNEQAIIKLDGFEAKEIAIVERNAKFKKLKKGEYRYLDKKLISPVTTLIYNDKVIFFIWKEPLFAISIESSTFAKAQTEYFNLLWYSAKR